MKLVLVGYVHVYAVAFNSVPDLGQSDSANLIEIDVWHIEPYEREADDRLEAICGEIAMSHAGDGTWDAQGVKKWILPY